MNLEELKAIREKAQKDIQLRQKEGRMKIVVGMGTSGIASGAREVLKAFVDEIATRNLADVMVTQTGEKGLASQEPLIEVLEEGKPTKFKVTIKYMSIFGDSFSDLIEHDLEYLKQTTVPGKTVEDYLKKISEELGELTQAIKDA